MATMRNLIILAFLSISPILFAAPSMPSSSEIVVNNRILANINGETISVMDVMKKMDLFLSQYYPQYLNSPQARLQFYTMQWKQTLQQMIDQKLMVADAESRKIETTDGEVREEIQNRWGPNVSASLDKLGLTLEEAKQLVHQELVVQKMQWLRVTSKVMSRMTTDVIRSAYKTHLQKNPPKEIWSYQFLTLRCDTLEKSLALAQEISKLYASSNIELAVAADLFKQKLPEEEWKNVTLSSDFQSEDKDLSAAYRAVLQSTSTASWSTPAIQQSRDGKDVVRIFHLKAHTKQIAAPFENLANRLKQDLLNEHADVEMTLYLSRLYQRFNYDPKQLDIPPHFEPFSF